MPLKTQVARFDLPKLFEHEESPHEEIEKQLNDLTNKVCHPSPGAPCDLFSHYGHLPRNPGYCWIQHHWDQAARYHYLFNASRFHTNPSIPSAVMTSGTTVVDLGQDHAIEGVDTTITPTHDHFLYLFPADSGISAEAVTASVASSASATPPSAKSPTPIWPKAGRIWTRLSGTSGKRSTGRWAPDETSSRRSTPWCRVDGPSIRIPPSPSIWPIPSSSRLSTCRPPTDTAS